MVTIFRCFISAYYSRFNNDRSRYGVVISRGVKLYGSVTIGLILFSIGAYNIFNVDNLTKEELGLKDLTIPNKPLITPYNGVAYPNDPTSHLNYAHYRSAQ